MLNSITAHIKFIHGKHIFGEIIPYRIIYPKLPLYRFFRCKQIGHLNVEFLPSLITDKIYFLILIFADRNMILTSAKTGYGLPALLAKLDEVLNHRVRTIEIVLPYDKLALADILRSRGSVAAEEYREDGVYYRGTVKIDDLHRFEEFLV